MCFLGVWKREETCRETGQRAKLRKCLPFLVWRVLGAIYSPDAPFEVATLQGPLASKGLWLDWSWLPWKYFDFLFPKRYGSWKFNGWIKSYGSWKLAVHQSVRYPGFHDISPILTPILTHEQSLEWDLIIFAMVLVSTHFDSRIKIMVFGPTHNRLQVKFGQNCQNSLRSLSLM